MDSNNMDALPSAANAAHWQMCQQFDALDDDAEDQIGGSTPEQCSALNELEALILAVPPECAQTREWFVKRLGRGVLNGWAEEFLQPYALALA